MPILAIILILLSGLWLVVPYLICMILKFWLWRYQFTSKPSNVFSLTCYKDIILRIPIGLNQDCHISIKYISFNLWPTVKISISGLSISLLIKNEFN